MQKEMRPILDQQLSKAEAERESLDVTIAEIHRRFSVLDDVESWNLLASEEITQGNGMDHLSAFGEQEVDSQEVDSSEETQTFGSNGLPLRPRDMFKQRR